MKSRSSLTAFLQRRASSLRRQDPELEEEQEELDQDGNGLELAETTAKNDNQGKYKPECKGKYVEDFRRAGFLSRLSLWWARGLFWQGIKREVEASELWLIRENDESELLSARLWEGWREEVTKKQAQGKTANLSKVIQRQFWFEFSFAFYYMMGWLVCILVTNGILIVALLNLLDDFANGEADTVMLGSLEIPYKGFYYCIAFFFGEMLRSICVNRHWELSMLTGVRVRGAVTAMLFQKMTKLRRGSDAIGQLLNIVSNDVERLRDAFAYGLFIVTTPISLLAIVALGQVIIGKAIWVGFLMLVLSVPIQAQTGNLTKRFRGESVVITDERVSLMNEILKASQLIKLYAWEDSFSAKVNKVRSAEMVKLRLTAYTKAFNIGFSQTLPVLTCLVTFLFHTLVFGEDLTPGQAFAILSLFNVSRFPLNVLPLGVRFVAEFFVAMKRISNCLMLEEVVSDESTLRITDVALAQDEIMIDLESAEFTWVPRPDSFPLSPDNNKKNNKKPSSAQNGVREGEDEQEDVSISTTARPADSSLVVDKLELRRGTVTAVVGTVGAGKSSLFAGLLGDMRMISGRSILKGEVAYVGQNPWVFNATVRANILLGKPYDEAKFKQTIKVCALEPDLKVLPSRDLTEIGERGINLSGGQKARLALARAVYSDADVFLLDDVLSAVDAHVSAHLWKECIKTQLKGKTVVLVTHALQYLPDTDLVVVLDSLRVRGVGTFAEISSQPDLRSLVVASADVNVHNHKNLTATSEPPFDELEREDEDSTKTKLRSSTAEEEEGDDISGGALNAFDASRQSSENRAESGMSTASHDSDANRKAGKLTSAEDRAVGAVSWVTVVAFARSAGGACLLWTCLVFFFISEASKYASDAWLAPWSEDRFDRPDWFYVVIFGAIAIFVGLLTFLRGMFFAWTALRAAQTLHNDAFLSVMSARMDFLQVTPLGRILARFSSDMDKVDVMLVDIAEMAISLLMRCLLSAIVICVVIPAFLVPAVPIAFLYILILRYTRRIVRQMKRIDNISRSPLLSEFQSLSYGLTSARTYRIFERSVQKTNVLVDETSRAFLGFFLSNRLIAINVDIITTTVVTLSALGCVIFASTISAGLAGLALTAALQTAGIFQFATRQAAELEAQFTSVERLRYFIENTPRENQIVTTQAAELSEEWPSRGQIEFRNYSTRYRKGLPLVLKDLSFTVLPGSKTALCGRTGSGKSTALLSCFRVLEAVGGSILIDGVDIASVPLKVLRSKAISVVPQDATLFSGTVRYNLDPLNEHSDEELWAALERVHLASFVRQLGTDSANDTSLRQSIGSTDAARPSATKDSVVLQSVSMAVLTDGSPSGLNFVIEQGGLNLSAGQRQLFCFARALLRKTRIICIDEGTSSVDSASDDQIQATLRESCKDVSLLVIAHRLQTVRHFDCICVLDQGRLVESGSPDELVRKQDGIFAGMWAKSVEERSRNMENVPSIVGQE